MARSARTFLLISLALLQSLCGLGTARSFVLCICIDGGIVLEAHDEACRCCVVDTCCDVPEDSEGEREADGCACTRFAVQGEDAAHRTTTPLVGLAAVAQITPPWAIPTPPNPRDPRGPLDLDPDPHDPLRELRTIVLRH